MEKKEKKKREKMMLLSIVYCNLGNY